MLQDVAKGIRLSVLLGENSEVLCQEICVLGQGNLETTGKSLLEAPSCW